MTIYSQHANRGKVQILASYQAPDGVRSVTVTSVENTALATPLVNALNRVSAYATVPLTVWDERRGATGRYPAGHLAALVEQDARDGLLHGAHSLWYEYVKLLLRRALTDLDAATASVPEPVRTAVKAEIDAEVSALIRASEDPGPEGPGDLRLCEFDNPFVTFESRRGNVYLGDPHCLKGERLRLDRLEFGVSRKRLEQAVDDLRILYDAFDRCDNERANLIIEDSLFVDFDPWEEPGHRQFLNIFAPMPGSREAAWQLEIGRWISDDLDDDDDSETGQTILRCVLATPPSASELVEVLNLAVAHDRQLAVWETTPVGEALEGTGFVVTLRYED
ncbi:hypothetical protein [Streptosporangium sp. NPDC002524]|uniref:hypothetical protein n=1 Tax=Streptosporangium sp. NPDC002524 TaxID=3154537 RepID=UPI00331F5D97